jgi:hypothetical protein
VVSRPSEDNDYEIDDDGTMTDKEGNVVVDNKGKVVEDPHKKGQTYPDPDGSGGGNPTMVPVDPDMGGGDPTTIWDDDDGGGDPTMIWDDAGRGGGDPTTTGRYVVVTTFEGSGLEIGLVQTGALELTI